MSVEVKTNQGFVYKEHRIPTGTKMLLSTIVERKESNSGKSFIIKNCKEYPILNDIPICTELIENSNNIIAALIKNVADAVKFGLDPHKWKASYRLGINYSDVTLIQRENAKKQNFKEAYSHNACIKRTIETLNEYKFNRKLLLLL